MGSSTMIKGEVLHVCCMRVCPFLPRVVVVDPFFSFFLCVEVSR